MMTPAPFATLGAAASSYPWPRAATTSCIGCHQHGGTGEATASILGSEARFPNASRTKVRRNFPADYAFTTTIGLDLASEMRSRIEALTPR